MCGFEQYDIVGACLSDLVLCLLVYGLHSTRMLCTSH